PAGAAGVPSGAGGAGGAGASGAAGSAGSAGGGGSAGGLVFSDRGLEGQFGAGTFDGAAWQGDRLALGAGRASGRFVSRVFDAGGPATWGTIAWEPGAPYRKPLPGAGGRDATYRAGQVFMAENVLLLHFDEITAGALAPIDASGRGHPVIVAGAGTSAVGPFGPALNDDLGDYVYAPIAAASPLNFGTSDFTWAVWVKTTQACPPESPPLGNRVHVGAEDIGAGRTHFWLGCTSITGNCPDADGTGRAGGTFCTRDGGVDACVNFCGRTVINDGAWHHVAVVKRGHAPGAVRLFVDGAPDLAVPDRPFSFPVPVEFDPGIEFAVGGFSENRFPSAGAFDEVAIFRRALGDDEIGALYRRGALGLALRVRACAQPDCSDAAFLGPAGAASAYLDATEGRPPTEPSALRGLPPARYFQYEAAFESTAPGVSPELYAVDVFASRP
ncbi:MAG TPA: LamG domain-containing protein, partial [Polyangiaceae bacterium]|nr:LamG domain-containing protein [Polyangiaceae bacterium]